MGKKQKESSRDRIEAYAVKGSADFEITMKLSYVFLVISMITGVVGEFIGVSQVHSYLIGASILWFASSVVMNMYSHLQVFENNNMILMDMDNNVEYGLMLSRVLKRNRRMKRMNIFCVFANEMGFIAFILYLVI